MVLVVTSNSNYYGGIMGRKKQNWREITRNIFVREEEVNEVCQILTKWCESIGWELEHLSKILERVGIRLPTKVEIQKMNGTFNLICVGESGKTYINMSNHGKYLYVSKKNIKESYCIDTRVSKDSRLTNPRAFQHHREKWVKAMYPDEYIQIRSLSSCIKNNNTLIFCIQDDNIIDIKITKSTGLKNKKKIIDILEKKFARLDIKDNLFKIYLSILDAIGDVDCEYEITKSSRDNPEECICIGKNYKMIDEI